MDFLDVDLWVWRMRSFLNKFTRLSLLAANFAHNIALQVFKENLIPYLEPEPPASIEHREADLATFFNAAGKRKLKEYHIQRRT